MERFESVFMGVKQTKGYSLSGLMILLAVRDLPFGEDVRARR